jgi:hypothetical protein
MNGGMGMRIFTIALAIFLSSCDRKDAEAEVLLEKAGAIARESERDEAGKWQAASGAVVELDALLTQHSMIHAKLNLISAQLSIDELDTAILSSDAITGSETEAGFKTRTAKQMVGTLDMKGELVDVEAEFDRFDRDWEALRKKLSTDKDTKALFDAANGYLEASKTYRLAQKSLSDATREGRLDHIESLHLAKADTEKSKRAAESQWHGLKEKLAGTHRLPIHKPNTSTK